MKLFRLALVALVFATAPALADTPKESTIRELLAVSQAQKLVDGMGAQIDQIMKASMDMAMQGKAPTPKQQQAIDRLQTRVAALMKEQLSWAKFEPMYIRLYQQTFTEEELVSMLEFYKTPGGQALINKMPAMMENVMKEMPAMMADMGPKMRQIQEDFMAEMKAAQ
jgi:hypothetical protein